MLSVREGYLTETKARRREGRQRSGEAVWYVRSGKEEGGGSRAVRRRGGEEEEEMVVVVRSYSHD